MLSAQAIVAANADARPADIMKLLAAAWQGQVRS